YVVLGARDGSRAGEAADGLERVARAALAANDRGDAAKGLAGLRAVAPTRPLGRYTRLAALDAADRGDTASAIVLLPGAIAAARGRCARSVSRPRRRETRAGRRGGGVGELPASTGRRHTRGHHHPAGAREDQRPWQGRRAVAGSTEPAVRMMLRSLFIVGAALLAACHHGPRVVPAPDPVADLAKARAQFRSGDYAKALVSFRRLTY